MNSPEKVRALLDQLDDPERVAGLQDDPQAAAALGFVLLARGQLAQLIPSDPEQLDALLLRGAEWALLMRSDDAEPAIVSGAARERTRLGVLPVDGGAQ